jgi:hypothetical protein
MKVYGPYLRKDGRKHVCIIGDDGVRTTKSYPKFLMEQKLGRPLFQTETVDHIDRDFTNDDPGNLRVIDFKQHVSDDTLRVRIPKEFECPTCGNTFKILRRANSYVNNRRKGKAGPFCSKSCAGKYSKKVQLGLMDKLPVDTTDYREYYYIDKLV